MAQFFLWNIIKKNKNFAELNATASVLVSQLSLSLRHIRNFEMKWLQVQQFIKK